MPQAGRNWNKTISGFLVTIKFIKLREDLCVFILFINGNLAAVTAVWVDDFILGFDSIHRKEWFIKALSDKFDTEVIGLHTNLLGLYLEQVSSTGGALILFSS
jgi:hypothetical protein